MLTHAELRDLVNLELRVHELPLNDTDLDRLIDVSVSELTGLFDLISQVKVYDTSEETPAVILGEDVKKVLSVWYRPSAYAVFASYEESNQNINGNTVKVAEITCNTTAPNRGFLDAKWNQTGTVQWQREGRWYEFPYEIISHNKIRLKVYANPSADHVVHPNHRPQTNTLLYEKADWYELRPIGWASSFGVPFSTYPPSDQLNPIVDFDRGYGLRWDSNGMVILLRLPKEEYKRGQDNLRVNAVLYYTGGDPIPLPKSFSRLITVMVCRRILQSFMGEEVANYLALYKREEDELKTVLYRQMDSWGTYPVRIQSAYAMEEGGNSWKDR